MSASMEGFFPLQRPISCRILLSDGTQLKISPVAGFSPNGNPRLSSISLGWQKGHRTFQITHPFSASADFSRRRQRKITSPKSKDSTRRGFTPRTQPTNTQKKAPKNNEEKEDPATSPSNDFIGSNAKLGTEIEIGNKVEADRSLVSEVEKTKNKNHDIDIEASSFNGPLPDYKISNFEEKGKLPKVPDSLMEPKNAERFTKSEENMTSTGVIDVPVYEREVFRKQTHSNSYEASWHESDKEDPGEAKSVYLPGKNVSGETDPIINKTETVSHAMQRAESMRIIDDANIRQFVNPKDAEGFVSISDDGKIRDHFTALKLEREENLTKEAIDKLAKKNFEEGNKIFCYPDVAKAGKDIEIFFNRSFSTLKNEPHVVIMGAYNHWKWKSFNINLNRSHLNGDWWSCRVHVPDEAYRIDFVFHNGNDVYDNNDEKDYYIIVEEGMDVFDFENFLLKEKLREQEEFARLKAEKEKLEEEQRRREADIAAREADRAQVREEVAKSMTTVKEILERAVTSVKNVWSIEPSDFKGGDKVRLYYNKSSGPLSQANEIWIHGGHNGWKDGLSVFSKLIKSKNKDGDWWYADVVLPNNALVLDWVFADGPPQRAIVFDNNHRQDFHAAIPKASFEEVAFFEEEQLYNKLQTERRLREQAIQAKAEKTARMKVETKARMLKTFLLSQKHVVYTDPLDVKAGSTITVFYNPSNTILNGKSEIWLRYSFNRWTHRMGPFPPERMLLAENGSHLKAIVKVPLDAYLMDFVFSEGEHGGVFDNKNGMDYHIPVLGGVVKEPPMHIVHIAVEMAPIAKVGGLGDVVTSLSRAVQDMNHNVDIILPKYNCLNFNLVKDLQFHKSYFWSGTEIKVWSGKVEGLCVYFLEPQNGLFWVGCIYGRKNDGERFGFFCHAALEFLLQDGFHPDIIHCHDWSSAPVAWLFKEHYRHYGLSKAHIVFTIHNLEFGGHLISKAMKFADKATTVSPTYAREISGNPSISPHIYKFHGILNGIDPDIWDPYNDTFIPVSYTSENVVEGKRSAKEALQQRLGLRKAELPLVGIITRLTHQKGIHLIKHAIWRTLERGGQVVLLGSAPDHRIQNDFVNLANQLHSSHNDRARLCLSYDEPLSHLIYAGADFILVPSIFEPCGLTQLTAMRYGSIPVVRKTGGLYDTVFDVDHDKERAQGHGLEPNGFNFDGADAAGVDYALNRAISAWYDSREWFNSLCKRVMEQDWSWNRPALDYLELYHAAQK